MSVMCCYPKEPDLDQIPVWAYDGTTFPINPSCCTCLLSVGLFSPSIYLKNKIKTNKKTYGKNEKMNTGPNKKTKSFLKQRVSWRERSPT